MKASATGAAAKARWLRGGALFALLAAGCSGANDDAWRAYADCAAAYRANVEARRSDPTRTPEMADMVGLQAEDYELAAIRAYAGEEADAAVRDHIDANVLRFIEMDRAGSLDTFVEACPEIDYETLF